MFVFDTSAFINGWRDHYAPAVFPGVWTLIGDGIGDGRILVPRQVFVELTKKDDEVADWAKLWEGECVDPSPDVQRMAGNIYSTFLKGSIRDDADPFVIAEASIRSFTVVTYEGRDFNGPTKKWADKMPGICRHLGVDCTILPVALGRLGGRF